MKAIAFLFPGQGSQSVGMGKDVFEEYDVVKERFKAAETITGLPISTLCFEGPMAALTETVNLQPAVTTVNLAFLEILRREGVKPRVSAGHSLGEFSALCAAGVVSEEDTLRMVFRRGELMHREATLHKGAMSAVIGLSIDAVRDLVAQVTEGVVTVANHNAEKQIVITGSPDAVKKAGEMAAAQGGKAIPLKVSGAWHSRLIQGAEAEFRDFLGTVVFHPPESPVIHNVTADRTADPDEIRNLMAAQLCSPVRWYESVLRLMTENVTVFVEVGPGKVLTGLVKKILPKAYPCEIYNVNDMKSLEVFLKAAA
ncbi:ACP S-malonyltransferase [Desulfococcus multivorans]|uniref:Malonyl CoA-acyl carrier protein transacylase n=1 Tax=Desulfococcus multivorans DSM 2059 TaxID=1121405 RepID=S7TZ28_DESML|nr:ACP S-malonyltransferase [Desulfococcus multivorans]AOY57367.1 FabD: malonyl CoA-acyl carrier protein transacylase [Desulfococcus multivorans]AQU99812.1 malonyl CoA-acyl carrier protein transacylase [Desulfococcus multivorans]EPR41995.1 malonyl CoA-acyl carrier protein transacylase [Desulfococcus multivorans DSM 2059]SKA10587.1 [acyl-carrier-protein] S-malonyltransferase [Desulfococcus multivorans DSM 2059]